MGRALAGLDEDDDRRDPAWALATIKANLKNELHPGACDK